jgi:hypothetical protein
MWLVEREWLSAAPQTPRWTRRDYAEMQGGTLSRPAGWMIAMPCVNQRRDVIRSGLGRADQSQIDSAFPLVRAFSRQVNSGNLRNRPRLDSLSGQKSAT